MLYPPILANTQPVIDIATKSLEIKYSLAPITSIDDFTYIEIFIAQQSNGRSIINSTTGTLIFHKYNISNNTISINPSNFYEIDWVAGNLYKVQLRLVTEDDQVSEWSTVMIIKTITAPSLDIKAEDVNLSEEEVVSSLTPTFQGVCVINSADKEIEERYQFKIYKITDMGAKTTIAESGWQNHILGEADIWHVNTILTVHDSYTIYYEIYTNNGYNAIQQYNFIVNTPAIEDTIPFNLKAIQNVTNARVDLMLSAIEQIDSITSNYVITRTSDKSNFLKFEDIKFLNYVDQSIPQNNGLLIFSDYTIESGVVYKYGFQRISTSDSKRSAMIMSNTVSVDFEYSYLYRDGIQLRLALNHNVSSFKHTVLRSKQDTLGSKYPFVLQNGNAYYAEFPISGLISYQDNYSEDLSGWKYGSWFGDPNARQETLIIDNPEDQPYPASLDTSSTFFINKTDGVYYKGEKIIDQSKFSIHKGETIEKTVEREDGSSYTFYQIENPSVDFTIDNNLTDNNIFIERKFREKVEEFLNEFNYKLYKSPTEGNIVVVLMNVSLKPIESLGRMLYEFSATAYEILDQSLESLNTYGIINIGEVKNLAELVENDPLSFGQLIITKELFEDYVIDESGQGYFKPIDLITLIKNQQNSVTNDGAIENENNEYIYAFKDVRTLWIEPLRFESVVGNFVELFLNNESIFVPLNRIFTITIPYSNTNSKIATSLTLNYTETPLIINYICTKHLQLNTNNVQRTISTTSIYDFDQVIWNKKTDSYGGNIREYIQNYLISKFKINNISGSYWKRIDGNRTYWYQFHYFDTIDIETQLGAQITIGQSEEDSDTFVIGEHLPSTRIFFKNIFDGEQLHDKYIVIENAEQAIINFVYYITETVTEEVVSSATEEGE